MYFYRYYVFILLFYFYKYFFINYNEFYNINYYDLWFFLEYINNFNNNFIFLDKNEQEIVLLNENLEFDDSIFLKKLIAYLVITDCIGLVLVYYGVI